MVFSAVNIVLDLVFVLMLDMGPGGVGAATSIADWTAFAVGIGFLLQTIARQGGWAEGALNRAELMAAGPVRELFHVNVNLMIRTWSMVIGFTWFANAGARQGTAALAGNHVLLQVITLWAFVLDAFAFIAETEVGRAIGRGSRQALRRAVRLTGEPMFAAGAVFAVLTVTLGPDALDALIADEAAREAAMAYLPWCAAVPFLGAGAWLMDGVFIGATSGRIMRNAGIASLLVYLAADFMLAPGFGNDGVWAAFIIYYLARAGALASAWPVLEKRLQSMPTASETDANPSA